MNSSSKNNKEAKYNKIWKWPKCNNNQIKKK